MTGKLKCLLVIVLILTGCANVYADDLSRNPVDYSGNQMLGWCDSLFNTGKVESRLKGLIGDASWDETIKVSSEATMCKGYIKGTAASLIIANYYIENKLARKDKMFFCMPSAVTDEQIERVAYNYFNKHRKKLNASASLLVLYALKEAYPCK